MAGLVQMADAQVDTEIKAFKFKVGEFPDIKIGEIAGRAVDYLRKNGVPVKGFCLNIAVVLSIDTPNNGLIIETIEIIQSKPITETRDLIRTNADLFALRHSRVPDQKIEHEITFFIDETQLED